MKLFRYLIIYWTTKDALLAAKIYQMIYFGINSHVEDSVFYEEETFDYSPVETPPAPKVSNKKQEVIDSLNYLRSKTTKTKKDKESIYALEMVLKNMK